MTDEDFPRERNGFNGPDWPFYWVVQASSSYLQTMESRLRSVGMDVAYWRVLMSIGEGRALSITEISGYCIIRPNTATKIVQRMVADQLVTTRPRPTDARVTEVTLTGKGEALCEQARAVAAEVFEQAFEGFTREERMMLNLLLEKLAGKLR